MSTVDMGTVVCRNIYKFVRKECIGSVIQNVYSNVLWTGLIIAVWGQQPSFAPIRGFSSGHGGSVSFADGPCCILTSVNWKSLTTLKPAWWGTCWLQAHSEPTRASSSRFQSGHSKQTLSTAFEPQCLKKLHSDSAYYLPMTHAHFYYIKYFYMFTHRTTVDSTLFCPIHADCLEWQ